MHKYIHNYINVDKKLTKEKRSGERLRPTDIVALQAM